MKILYDTVHFIDDGEVAPFVAAFDDILSGPFKTFCDLTQKIGGDVTTHGNMVEAAFKAQREFLVIASKSKKPADKDLQSLLLPLSNKISEIQDYREKNRRSIYFNHLSAISESIPALGWVAVVSKIIFIHTISIFGKDYSMINEMF